MTLAQEQLARGHGPACSDLAPSVKAKERTAYIVASAGSEQAVGSTRLAGPLAEWLLGASMQLDPQTGDLDSRVQPAQRSLKLAGELLSALGAEAVLLPAAQKPRWALWLLISSVGCAAMLYTVTS